MADLVNGCFELLGGIFIVTSCRQLRRDKQVRGVCWAHAAFFMLWGYWNLYFYPQVGAWCSFIGGIGVVSANSVWLGMMLFYARAESTKNRSFQRVLHNPESSRFSA